MIRRVMFQAPPAPSTAQGAIVRIDALGVVDGAGAAFSPGSVLAQVRERRPGGRHSWPLRLLAVGRTAGVAQHEAARAAATIRRPGSILIPGLVNAHTHLDLTHIGPRPHNPEQGFMAWIEVIRRERHRDETAIAASVRRGTELSLAAGVVAVGDIAGSSGGRLHLTPWKAVAASGLAGVSYLEYFGIGGTQERTLAALEATLAEAEVARDGRPVRLGLQPHAPNSVGTALYRGSVAVARARGGMPLATHLAESPEEREFIARARGPQREFLERLGIWEDSILADVGHGQTPVVHLADVLAAASAPDGPGTPSPFLVAHVNDADDGEIETLARTGTRVAYCPRASAYFGVERAFGPHRYRDMLRAGIGVALGTDSIVNLPPGRGISILDEMRFLGARDGADPALLLRMGTILGARALGLPESAFCFEAGAELAGLVAVRVIEDAERPPGARAERGLAQVLLGGETADPELLFGGSHSCLTESVPA